MKILFLTLYPELQLSTRFRVIQFLPYLNEQVKCDVRPLVSGGIFSKFYGSHSRIGKILFHTFELITRIKDIISSFRYDAVFLQKGIATINFRGMHKLLFLFNKNIIFDFDDAITIQPISKLQKFPLNLLDDHKQFEKIVRLAKVVIVGNEKLKSDISGLNHNIRVIPTPVDTEYYPVNPDRYCEKSKVTIFWSGNQSGHFYLKICAPAIVRLAKRYPIRLTVLSDLIDPFLNEIFKGTNVNIIKWGVESEKEAFFNADIGIMPLYDTLWNRRKCAFKALLYMSNGIPVVSSPVGIAVDFFRDGVNGFLADSEEEWFNKLEMLIKDKSLRIRMGLEGRKTVEDNFSLSRWGKRWQGILLDTARQAK
jgi:glycosyltransferase involved in cell wall biosynthesis